MAFEKLGYRAKPYLAHQLGIKTDSVFSKARIQSIDVSKILEDTENGVIPVIAGFQGVDEDMNITTLGRGGSDTSAVAVAAALQAQECEIYTDVPAVFTADPRLVPQAKEIPKLSFEEMMEMASLGSKILHIRSVEIGAKHGVRIHVRSTFEAREGTWVVPEGEIMEDAAVSAVTHETTTAVLKLYPLPEGSTILAKLFEQLAAQGIVVDIITQSLGEKGQRLAFSIPVDDLVQTQNIVREQLPGVEIEVMKEVSKVSIVGVGMRNHPGVAARFFRVLSDQNVPIHLVTTSEIKVSAVIDRKDLEKAAQALHTKFDLDR
jgi:aspartate kinase